MTLKKIVILMISFGCFSIGAMDTSKAITFDDLPELPVCNIIQQSLKGAPLAKALQGIAQLRMVCSDWHRFLHEASCIKPILDDAYYPEHLQGMNTCTYEYINRYLCEFLMQDKLTEGETKLLECLQKTDWTLDELLNLLIEESRKAQINILWSKCLFAVVVQKIVSSDNTPEFLDEKTADLFPCAMVLKDFPEDVAVVIGQALLKAPKNIFIISIKDLFDKISVEGVVASGSLELSHCNLGHFFAQTTDWSIPENTLKNLLEKFHFTKKERALLGASVKGEGGKVMQLCSEGFKAEVIDCALLLAGSAGSNECLQILMACPLSTERPIEECSSVFCYVICCSFKKISHDVLEVLLNDYYGAIFKDDSIKLISLYINTQSILVNRMQSIEDIECACKLFRAPEVIKTLFIACAIDDATEVGKILMNLGKKIVTIMGLVHIPGNQIKPWLLILASDICVKTKAHNCMKELSNEACFNNIIQSMPGLRDKVAALLNGASKEKN